MKSHNQEYLVHVSNKTYQNLHLIKNGTILDERGSGKLRGLIICGDSSLTNPQLHCTQQLSIRSYQTIAALQHDESRISFRLCLLCETFVCDFGIIKEKPSRTGDESFFYLLWHRAQIKGQNIYQRLIDHQLILHVELCIRKQVLAVSEADAYLFYFGC